MKILFIFLVSLGTCQCFVEGKSYNSQYNEIIKNSSLPNAIEEELPKEAKFFDEFNDCKYTKRWITSSHRKATSLLKHDILNIFIQLKNMRGDMRKKLRVDLWSFEVFTFGGPVDHSQWSMSCVTNICISLSLYYTFVHILHLFCTCDIEQALHFYLVYLGFWSSG